MFRNIKTVNHLKARSFLEGGFYGYSKYSNHSPFIYKPTQEIHDKQVPKYDFNKYYPTALLFAQEVYFDNHQG